MADEHGRSPSLNTVLNMSRLLVEAACSALEAAGLALKGAADEDLKKYHSLGVCSL